MTNSYNPTPQDTFRALALMEEEERQRQEALLSQTEPTKVGKHGPDVVPGQEEIIQQYRPEIGPPLVPGASEVAMEEREAAKGPLTDVIDNQQDSLDAKIALLQGTGDTLFGAIKGIGWLAGGGRENSWVRQGTEALDDYWHQVNPQSDNGAHHAIRKMWGVIGPSVIIPAASIPKLASLPFATHIPKAAKTTAAFAYTMGIDAAVFNSSTSSYDENAAKALNDMFGWNLPGATPEGAGPDERWKYNQMENMGFAAAGGLIQGVAALNTWRKALKARPKKNMFEASWVHKWDTQRHKLKVDGPPAPGTQVEWDPGVVVVPKTNEAAEGLVRNANEIAQQTNSPAIKEIEDQIEKVLNLEPEALPPGRKEEMLAELEEVRKGIEAEETALDPLTRNINEAANARANSLADEAAEHLQTNQGQYDPILHEPAEAQAKATSINGPADPLGAVVDTVRIQENMGTIKGQARAVLPTRGMRALLNAPDGTARGEILEEIVQAIEPSREMTAIIEGGRWKIESPKFIEGADRKVQQIMGEDPKVFAEALNNLKSQVQLGVKTLDDDQFVEWSLAAQTMFRDFDPDKLRAAALVTQQAADGATNAANAAMVLDGVTDTTRQLSNMYDNLGVVLRETNTIRSLWGYKGQLLDMAKDGRKLDPESLAKLADDVDNIHTTSQMKATQFVEEMKRIATEEPEYLKAFTKAYDFTGGNVDDITKLNEWAAKKVSWTKAFLDLDPKTPSLWAQGVRGIMYNSMLNGLAPLRALTGNAMLTIGKPVSILAGSAWQAGTELVTTGATVSSQAQLKRALYTYGGIVENFQRAWGHAMKEWDFVVKNPEQAMQRGRDDIKFANSDAFEVLEDMADGWYNNGNYAELFLLNMARGMSFYNNLGISRWGVNLLHTIDGFTNSIMASGFARAKAYDELLEANGGVTIGKGFQQAFSKRQQDLYSTAFDSTGLVTDEAVKHASQEIALNLDNDAIKLLNKVMDTVPALKPLFMFPRTGLNGLNMAWTYNPISGLGLAIGKARRTFEAITPAMKDAVLREHGITEFSEIAYQALKNEYRGRQLMGAGVVMAAGMFAVNGNLTGNGPHDTNEKKDMMRLGWKPLSIRIGGTWHSYRGMEPYQQILSLIADATYVSERVDQAWSEDIFRKIGYALSMNVTNQTFLSGLSPLANLFKLNNEGAWQRFAAQVANPLLPQAGVRSILNKAITPQLKDVEMEFWSYMKNFNRFLYSSNDDLKDQLDIFTGERINYTDPMTSAINSILPFFKSNGGTESWRQWLLGTGWNGLNNLRTNRITGQPLKADERYFINNWIAKHGGLKKQIQQLMVREQKGSVIKKYVDARGQKKQKEMPISETYIHQELDRMIDNAFKAAWHALELEHESYYQIPILEQFKQQQIEQGNPQGASRTSDQIQQLLQGRQPLN